MKKILIPLTLLALVFACYAISSADEYQEHKQEQERYEQKQYEQERYEEKQQEEKDMQDRIYQKKLDNYYMDKKNNDTLWPVPMPIQTPYSEW